MEFTKCLIWGLNLSLTFKKKLIDVISWAIELEDFILIVIFFMSPILAIGSTNLFVGLGIKFFNLSIGQ